MKFFVLSFLLILSNLAASSQTSDSLFCFTKKEITVLANKFRETEDSVVYLKALAIKKDSLILLQDSLYIKANSQIKLYNENIVAWKKKEAEYKTLLKNTEPKWYQNNFLWFGIGVFATLLIAK